MLFKRLYFKTIVFVMFCISSITISNAEIYPDTIWVPVTFYDFHSDRTNPEFEARHKGMVRTGMVATTLGDDNKPVLGTSPYLNYYITKWFRPWVAGDFTIPKYDPRAEYKIGYYGSDSITHVPNYLKEYEQDVNYLGIENVDYDTAFKNVVIHDTLPFVHIDTDRYQFLDTTFFPLDNRGFGNEWNHELGEGDTNKQANHNYSFTMELHWTFTKRPGLVFDFNGDDDVWVYVNKSLQTDLGGIHQPAQATFGVDNIEDLQNGRIYDLHVFYAERHSLGSFIRITTNIIYAPSNLRLYKYPGEPDIPGNMPLGSTDTAIVGQPFPVFGHVFDTTGEWRREYDSLITWTLDDPLDNGGISNKKGESTVFTATEANGKVVLRASFRNLTDSTLPDYEALLTIYIKDSSSVGDLKPYPLHLYGKSGSPDQAGNPRLSGSVSTKAGEAITIYGHVFDTNDIDNLSHLDQFIEWSIIGADAGISLSSQTGASTSATPTDVSKIITLQAKFTDPGNPSRPSSTATIRIETTPGPEYALEIIPDSVFSADHPELKQLVFGKGQDSVKIWAIVKDRFGNFVRWADNASWTSLEEQIISVKIPSGKSTILSRNETTIGERTQIVVTEPGLVPDTIEAITSQLIPFALRLYGKQGVPDNSENAPLGSTLSVKAGDVLTIYGHLFDYEQVWQEQLDKHITWQIVGDESLVLDPKTGDHTVFIPTNADKQLTLVARFSDPESPSRPASEARLTINVSAGAAYRLEIIPDSSKMHDSVFTNYIFPKGQSTVRVFAVVKDKFGNVINLANLAGWSSQDISIADVQIKNGSSTVIEKKETKLGEETFIIVSQDGLIPDTLIINSVGNSNTGIGPNPFIPGKTIAGSDDYKVQEYYKNIFNNSPSKKGVLIAIETPLPLMALDSTSKNSSYGKIKIFDALGNIVQNEIDLIRASLDKKNGRDYGAIWDGKNMRGRYVGAGAYLAVFRGKTIDGKPFIVQAKIGVSR